MAEFSKNLNTEPMSRKNRARLNAAHTVISFLTEKHPIHEVALIPLPSLIPGQIGSVAIHIEGTELQQQSFDLYRCAPNRWDDQGNYFTPELPIV